MGQNEHTDNDACEVLSFERNNYYLGKLLTVRDFEAEQAYFNKKRWLINRTILGWGVVWGLEVYKKDEKFYVKPGMAIDCYGREILVREEEGIKSPLLQCHTEQKETNENNTNENKTFRVLLKYGEKKMECLPLPPMACEQTEKAEYNRIQDSFEMSVEPEPETGTQGQGQLPLHTSQEEKSIKDCTAPCLVIAKIMKTGSEIQVDSSFHRRQVYRFTTDYPHVIKTSWAHGKEMEYKNFENIYKNCIEVWFDCKMDTSTLNEITFVVMVKTLDQATGSLRYEQIPGTIEYKYDDEKKDSSATFAFSQNLSNPSISEKGHEFVVVLKGDFILSAQGMALDGNFIGGKLPSGNGTQGGDFFSNFYVKRQEQPTQKQPIQKQQTQ